MSEYRFGRDDYVTWHAENWKKLFAEIAGKPDVTMLEIGSFEGRSAVWFLEHVLTHETSRLICIDPWWGDSVLERNFDGNIAASGQSHRVRKIKAPSHRALGWLPDGSLDAVYVDGSHEACDVALDGLLSLHKLKPDGLMLFDDYGWADPAGRRHLPPKPGIDAVLELVAHQVEVVQRGYQVVVRNQKKPGQ